MFNFFKKKNITTIGKMPIGVAASQHNWLQSTTTDDPIITENNLSLVKLKKMLADNHIYSVVQSRKSAILAMEYEILGDDKEKVQLITDIIHSIDLRRFLNQILDAVFFGYQVFEIFWKHDGKHIIIDQIIGKPSWWFEFDNFGTLKFIDSIGNSVYVPSNKFLLVQHNPTYTNPYGDALLSKCFYPYTLKKGALTLWSEFLEKYGIPFLIGTTEASQTEEDLNKFQAMLDSAKRSFTAAVNPGFTITSHNIASTTNSDNFATFINFCNAEISKAILSQTLTTENTSGTGSFAMSNTHFKIRADIVGADKTLAENAINNLIKIIIDLNYSDKVYPSIRLFEKTDVDLILAQRDQILNNIVDFTDVYIQKNYGLIPDTDFKIKNTPPSQSGSFAEKQDVVKSVQEEMINSLNKIAQSVVRFSLDLMPKVSSFEELQSKIVEEFPGLEDKELEDYIGVALDIAYRGGFVNTSY